MFPVRHPGRFRFGLVVALVAGLAGLGPALATPALAAPVSAMAAPARASALAAPAAAMAAPAPAAASAVAATAAGLAPSAAAAPAVAAPGAALASAPGAGLAPSAAAAPTPSAAAAMAEVLLSQGKAATASSAEGADTAAAMAVDGNAGTRWSSAFSDTQWLQVDLGAPAVLSRIVLTWEAAYGRGYKLQGSADGSSWTDLKTITDGDGGTDAHTVTGTARYVRMLGTQRGTGYGYSLWEFQVYGEGGQTSGCATANAAQGKPATASSTEGAAYAAGAAVDGDSGTRWSSAASDPQWIQVDLGSSRNICKVTLIWEAAYGTAYKIQSSPDASAWTDLKSVTGGDGGTDALDVSGTGRYVRMLGTQRGTGYGYSLWELQINTGDQSEEPGDWTEVWREDFTGPAGTSPSAADWIRRTGTSYPGGAANWGTGEVETMSDSTANVSLDGDGHLSIKAVKDRDGNWTSGRVETQRTDFEARSGEMVRFSARLKLPDVAKALGYWPGFRATGAAYRGNYTNWPGVGETDIMTAVNGADEFSNTLHCGTAPDGVCNEYNGRTSGFATCGGCATAYHEFSQVIDRTQSDEEIRFYLDGRQTWVVRQSQVGVAAWQAAVHHGFYLRLDLAIGGSLPNAIAGVTTPSPETASGGVLSADWVSVARRSGATPAPMTDGPVPAGPSVVRVTGGNGNWQLSVNGQPYLIKGLTYGPPQAAADGYMRDLKAMGVNTIRTWGVDDANTPALLDAAARNGIKVIVGHWLNQGADYINDTAYKTTVKNEIVARVNALKNRQGVLMWDVGNEVILTMQDHGLPADVVEQRRVAYAKFVNEVAVAVHAADPNHPVTSTDAYTHAWTYYKAHSPALDLLAVNSYGAVHTVKNDWIAGGYGKPYIVTEAGPDGEWEVPNDVNGVPDEPTDLEKGQMYTASWNAISGHAGVALGATMFHYGLENDFGGVWLNITPGGWRRHGFHALQQAFTGRPTGNTPPRITSMTVGSQTAVPAGGTFTVDTQTTDPDGDLIRYHVMVSDKHITGNRGFRHARFTQTAPGRLTVTAPEQLGVWKVYVYAFDGHGNAGIEQRSFRVVPPVVDGTNVARGKPTTASSYQASGDGGPFTPDRATDGSFSSRWASEWADPQWIRVDLGALTPIKHVQLGWEGAYAKAYQLQTSVNGTDWTTVHATTTGDGGFDGIDLNTSARYVRLNLTERGTTYGYSLWEFGVYR
ncbi:discoidin domain-containing protein [Nonomuraea wenchangensis]|uniref:discoidin domain-containing protein n=1 Tax=Nonomuraea wenchangensis TaxID=568860 RepID=UPI00331DD8F4